MAVAFEGFSIREYASKMRSVDVVKCWPFGGGGKETKREEVERRLPPISCRKYRWWVDELEVVRSTHGDDGNKKIVEDGEEKAVCGKGNGFVSTEKPGVVSGTGDEEKLMMICPVCRSFTAATVNAVSAHIDSCLAQASREERRQMRTAAAAAAKVKSKAPKKRSIMEIFAVAPQIETVELSGDEEEVSGEDFDWRVVKASDVAKQKRKKKCSKEYAAVMKLKLKNKIKKKKKMLKNKADGGVVDPSRIARLGVKKEKNHKLKVPCPVDLSGQLKVSLRNKRSGKEISDTGAIQKKKPPGMKSSSVRNKLKVVRASKLITKYQRQQEPPVFPVHSILKNHTKVISSQNSSAVSNVHCSNLTNVRNVQQSDRHVRFSGKDDILGPMEKQYSSTELPQVQSLCKVFSDVMAAPLVRDHPKESDKDLPAVDEASEMDRSNEDVSISISNGTTCRHTHENTLSDGGHDHVSIPTLSSRNKDKGKTYADKSVDLNQASQHHGNLHLFHQGNSSASRNLSYPGIPKPLQSTLTGCFNPNTESQADGNVQRLPNASRNLAVSFADPISRSAAMSSLENVNATLQPFISLATSAETDGRYQFQPQAAQQNSNGFALQYQSFCHLSPKDLMSSICSSVEWKKKREAVHRDKCIDDDFIGLPLNSQGEFIQLHSSGKGGFNLMKKQNTIMGSSSFPMHNLVQLNSEMGYLNMKEKHYVEAAPPKDKFKIFTKQNYREENPGAPLSSRLGNMEWQSPGRTEVHWKDSVRRNNHSVHQLDSDINLSYHGCRQYDPTQNRTEKERNQSDETSDCRFLLATQPTMRLMGKDVTVGISNREVQGFEDGKIWTDKEIITEHCPTMAVSDSSSLKRQFQQEWISHPVSGKSKESMTHSGEVFPMKAEPRYARSYLNWQTYITQQNGLPLISGNPSAKLHPFFHPLPSQTLLNKTSKFQESCNSGIESINMSSQIPVTESTSSNACQHMLLNSTQVKCKQSQSHGTTSAFHFPFSNQECGKYVKPSCSQSSSQSLPKWLQNATQQKQTPLTSQPYFERNAVLPCAISGTNFSANSSPYNTSIISYPHNPNTFHPQMQISSGPASFVHPSLIPTLPGFKPTSVINTSHGNKMKVKDRTKSKCFRTEIPDHAKKAKKRPATKAGDSEKAMKRRNLEMQEGPSAVKGLKESVFFSGYTQYNVGGAEFDAYRDKARDVAYSPVETHKNGFRDSSRQNSFRLDGVARAGPVKLSAGAKHILKPSQNMDLDKSKPTHSTIPFAAVINSDKISEFQKSAQIYRF